MCHFFQTYLNSRYICLRYLTIFEEIHFLNFDKNLNPSCVMEGKKKEKNVSERVKRRLCSRWNNCTLEMMVWKGKEFEFKCYCVHTFLSAEDISLTGSHVFVFFPSRARPSVTAPHEHVVRNKGQEAATTEQCVRQCRVKNLARPGTISHRSRRDHKKPLIPPIPRGVRAYRLFFIMLWETYQCILLQGLVSQQDVDTRSMNMILVIDFFRKIKYSLFIRFFISSINDLYMIYKICFTTIL